MAGIDLQDAVLTREREADRSFGKPKWANRRSADLSFTRENEPRSTDDNPAPAEAPPPSLAAYVDVKFRIHEQLLRELDLDKVQQKRGAELRKAVEEAAALILLQERLPLARNEQLRLVGEITDEVLGYGPLEPLLADPSVTEIMVNGPQKVYVERAGRLTLSEVSFRDDAHLMRIIERIVSPLGRRIDESSPMVDARLPDGSRVNAIIPPLAVRGPSLTIRKFSRTPITVDKLINYGSITPEVATFLKACVEGHLNVVVCGGTGSGKTTLLNVLSAFIPGHERIVTIEDPCELQLNQPHVVQLETRPPNMEGRGEVNQRQLLRNALRMRPDRIIVGEVRTGEAFDMLQAMNTGHEGSLTTVHANTARDALARIENMVLMAGLDLPVKAIREQIASGVGLVVHVNRMMDGSRRLTSVTEILGMEGETIATQDIFVYRMHGLDASQRVVGTMEATGIRPKCLEKLRQRGINLSDSLFGRPTEPTSPTPVAREPGPGLPPGAPDLASASTVGLADPDSEAVSDAARPGDSDALRQAARNLPNAFRRLGRSRSAA